MDFSQEAEQASLPEQRQYDIDRITAQYEEEYRAGNAPQLSEYLRQYPDMADELMEFAVYFHTIAAELPEPDEDLPIPLSPASNLALARIRAQPHTKRVAALEGLIEPGLAAGYPPTQLADVLEISLDVLAKLEERAIAVASIPEEFIQRVAETLSVAYDAVFEHLGGEQPQMAYAVPPPQPQESFLSAILASPLLSEGRKQAWEKRMRAN